MNECSFCYIFTNNNHCNKSEEGFFNYENHFNVHIIFESGNATRIFYAFTEDDFFLYTNKVFYEYFIVKIFHFCLLIIHKVKCVDLISFCYVYLKRFLAHLI